MLSDKTKGKHSEELVARGTCYTCYRPLSLCLCSHVKPIETKTKFIILMHPKEFKKTKNGTGRLTHLSLPNSSLYIDVDFSHHNAINAILNDENNLCYVLYPSKNSINLNTQKIAVEGKQLCIFIIDSTWPCSVKMLKLSGNLQNLPKLSFTHSKTSQFQIKEQPADFCLSTIESTLTILELLAAQEVETLQKEQFNHFLDPFLAMVDYQLHCITHSTQESVRFRTYLSK